MSSDSFSNLSNDKHQIFISTKEGPAAKETDETLLSEIAVWRALFANIGIATVKLICWFFSRSSAMLSESIHSGVDAFNSLCLLIGLKRGSKPADKFHPFGYGLEANIWALFASILMLIGTVVSIYSGWDRLFYHHQEIQELLHNYNLVAVALVVSILFEAWAVSSASSAVMHEAEVPVKNPLDAFLKSFAYINQIKSPTTKFVWYEDTVALAGVMVAFVAISISKFVMPVSLAHIPDAIASISIGCMLLGLTVYLLKNNVNALTGASAKPQIEEKIREIAQRVHGVSQVHDLKTMDMGTSGLIVNMEVEVDPETQVKDADNIADKLEQRIREKIKNIAHITIEMQANDIEENWSEKFEKLVQEGKDTGLLNPREAKMLSKFFDFTNTVAWEVMVPRTDVNFVDVDDNIEDLIDIIVESGHTRIPVYKENIDNIIGVVNAKDVLRALKTKDKSEIKLEDLVREISIVPETKPISDMFNEFNKNKIQIAAVVDEHGGVAGIITVEDVLEEIVGEIWDEYDVQVAEIIKIDENTLNVYSKMNIYDINDRFGLDLPTEDFQTIGGYVFGLLGREPEVGDEVQADGLSLKVESMDGHKITRVMIYNSEGFVDKQAVEEEEL